MVLAVFSGIHSGNHALGSWVDHMAHLNVILKEKQPLTGSPSPPQITVNTLRTGLLNCLNARSRGLTFSQRASCI